MGDTAQLIIMISNIETLYKNPARREQSTLRFLISLTSDFAGVVQDGNAALYLVLLRNA